MESSLILIIAFLLPLYIRSHYNLKRANNLILFLKQETNEIINLTDKDSNSPK